MNGLGEYHSDQRHVAAANKAGLQPNRLIMAPLSE